MNNILKILKKQGKTRKWLANELNMAEISICNYALNRSQPSLKKLFKIAKVLNVKPSEIINDNYE